jgi:Cadherin domain/FG-GAP-like repeat
MTDTTPTWAPFSFDHVIDAASAAPVIISDGGGDTAEITLAETTTAVTTVMATDPDAGTLTYAIVGRADQGHFQIDTATGVLTFVTAPDFMVPTDADGNNSYEVNVRASDGALFDDQAIAVYVTGVSGTGMPPGWQTRGTGDFDRDGDSDILWRHQDGAVATWEMEHGQHVATHDIAFASTGWDILTSGDFDGDGDSDILWRHRDGAVASWEMENGAYVTNHNLAAASSGWRVEGVADFDADGDGDILWRHSDGAVVSWEMEDGDYVTTHNLAVASSNWQVDGTADFDRDGDADILWSHRDGAVVTWEMQDGDYVATRDIMIASTDWQWILGIIIPNGAFMFRD